MASAVLKPMPRMSRARTEATGFEAKTIHRLLEVDPKGGGFKRCDKFIAQRACCRVVSAKEAGKSCHTRRSHRRQRAACSSEISRGERGIGDEALGCVLGELAALVEEYRRVAETADDV